MSGNIRDIYEQALAALDESRLELEALLAAIDDQRQKIVDLEDEVHGLRLSAVRLGLSLDDEDDPGVGADIVPIQQGLTIPGSKAVNLDAMTRSDAVFYVLSLHDRALDRQAIQTQMVSLGRIGDSVDQISLALTNLKRSDRVVRIGNGRWRVSVGASASSR